MKNPTPVPKGKINIRKGMKFKIEMEPINIMAIGIKIHNKTPPINLPLSIHVSQPKFL